MMTVAVTNDDDDVEWFVSTSSAVMACKTEKRYFFFYFMFFLKKILLLLLFLLELLQGLRTTWLQVQKHIGVHTLDVNLKAHLQGKQVYVGLHHLVQILYWNQTLCVCVCVLPRPKVGSKTSFGAACSFLPLKFQNSKLHSL
jgi:hypothetical protein